MSERALYRVGSWAAIVGAVIALVFNLLHPRLDEFDDFVGEELRVVRDSDAWIPIHLGLLVGVALIVFGLFALARSMKGGPAEGLARLALGGLVVSTPVAVVALAVDGYATKEIADSTAAGAEAAGLAVAHISWALFMGLIIAFIGVTPLLFGLAVAADDRYPRAMGWVAAVLALGAIVTGVVGTTAGPSAGFFIAFVATSGLLTLWILVMGVLLGRRAAVVVA